MRSIRNLGTVTESGVTSWTGEAEGESASTAVICDLDPSKGVQAQALTELPEGPYLISLEDKTDEANSIETSTVKIYVYDPALPGVEISPTIGSFGDVLNLTLPAPPWDYEHVTVDEGAFHNGAIQIRFQQELNGRELPSAAADAELMTDADNSTYLTTFVPMPRAGTADISAVKIQVSLNGQQFYETGAGFEFDEYCGGRVSLNELRGELRDHAGGGPPRPYSDCSWLIDVSTAVGDDGAVLNNPRVTLQLQEGSRLLSLGREYVRAFDGASTRDAQLLRWPMSFDETAEGELPEPILSTGAQMLIEFRTGHTDGDTVSTGFSAVYAASSRSRVGLVAVSPRAGASSGGDQLAVVASMIVGTGGFEASAYAGYSCVFSAGAEAYFVAEHSCLDTAQADADPLASYQTSEATLSSDETTFTCDVPQWVLEGSEATQSVSLTLQRLGDDAGGADVPDDTRPPDCSSAPELSFLYYRQPELDALSPDFGPHGTRLMLRGRYFLDPTVPAFVEGGVKVRCQFDGYQVTEAEYIDNSTLSCVAPMPLRSGPNPRVEVRVSNNGDEWSGAQYFTYRTYCGGEERFAGETGSFADHTGEGSSLPNSRCIFVVDPPAEDGGGASGGVQLVFDRLAVLQDDLVRVYRRNSTTGDDSLLMDVGVYLSEFAPLSSALRLRSGYEDFEGNHQSGLPVRVEFTSGRAPMEERMGIAVSYVSLTARPCGPSGEQTCFCPAPTMLCPTEEEDEMSASVEQSGRASASQLDMETAVSGVAPQGGMALHFLEIPVADAARVLEVEVELLPPNDGAAATVLVLEQPGTTDATVVDATSCLDDEPADNGGGAQDGTPELAVCPTSAGGLEAALAQSDSAASRRVGSFIRLGHCVSPDAADAAGVRRFVVAVHGDEVSGAATAVKYRVSWQLRALPSLDDIATSASATLASADGALAGRRRRAGRKRTARSPSPPASSARCSASRARSSLAAAISSCAAARAPPRTTAPPSTSCRRRPTARTRSRLPTARRRGTATTCGTSGCAATPASTAPASRCPRR